MSVTFENNITIIIITIIIIIMHTIDIAPRRCKANSEALIMS